VLRQWPFRFGCKVVREGISELGRTKLRVLFVNLADEARSKQRHKHGNAPLLLSVFLSVRSLVESSIGPVQSAIREVQEVENSFSQSLIHAITQESGN
jgi:hypothetical protein